MDEEEEERPGEVSFIGDDDDDDEDCVNGFPSTQMTSRFLHTLKTRSEWAWGNRL